MTAAARRSSRTPTARCGAAADRAQLERAPARARPRLRGRAHAGGVDRALPATRALAHRDPAGAAAAPETLRLGKPAAAAGARASSPRASCPRCWADLDPAIKDLAPLEPRLRDALRAVPRSPSASAATRCRR